MTGEELTNLGAYEYMSELVIYATSISLISSSFTSRSHEKNAKNE